MNTIEKHYVRFVSPGTLFAETTVLPIDSWDTKKAVEMAERVIERYGAKPYAFYFQTNLEAEPVSDGRGGTMKVEPKQLRISDCHYLGGRLETLDEIEARNDPKEETLRWNMRANHYPVVIVNTNSFRSTLPFEEAHVIVGASGEIVERGDDPKWVQYRASKAMVKRSTER